MRNVWDRTMQQPLLRCLAVFTAFFVSASACADETRRLTVISAFARDMHVVTYRPSLGSHLDQNTHEAFPVPEGELDRFAVDAAANTLGKLAIDGRRLSVLRLPFGPDELAPVDPMSSPELPSSLREKLTRENVTHVLLLLPVRAPADLKAAHTHLGTGYLEGIGFYVDRRQRMRRADTGELGVGFIAPYAYFSVTLFEVESMRSLASRRVIASFTVSAARASDSTDAWQALTAAQKISALKRLIRIELERVLPDLMASG